MSKGGAKDQGELLVCRNAKATQRYTIEDRFEAGMVLQGSEVKSLRARRADLEGSYAAIERGELYLHQMHIAPYEQAGQFNHEPKRTRKLLAHKHELEKLDGRLSMRGYTLVALRVYFKNGRAKIELGLGKGKNVEDKRQDIKKKDADREARAAMTRARKS
ncbi:MAG: SsrA-binding protein SmpB [Sandaracinaceae bacterium]|nr:SsrA-binding protein SmpB [Sandaracinaceae bacterium]